ncbi:MAG: hypothetical protein WBL92_10245 [Methanothrix sp.]
MVYHLRAFLAERVLDVNGNKPQEIRGFLDKLEGYMGGQGGGSHTKDQATRSTMSMILSWLRHSKGQSPNPGDDRPPLTFAQE